MRWRKFSSRDKTPRPKAKALDEKASRQLLERTQAGIARSYVLSHIPVLPTIRRSRLYLFGPYGKEEGPWARITPIARSRQFLLDRPWGDGWSEQKKGALAALIRFIGEDTVGTFHGLGAIERHMKAVGLDAPPAEQVRFKKGKFVHTSDASPCAVCEVLHFFFGVPLNVVREPVEWYERHRTPSIAAFDIERKRILVHFSQVSGYGEFGGTVLYAWKDGAWAAYTIKPKESSTIETAEAWLGKRDWEGW